MNTYFDNAFKAVSVMTGQELWLSFPLIVDLHANATGRLILTFLFNCSHITGHSCSTKNTTVVITVIVCVALSTTIVVKVK